MNWNLVRAIILLPGNALVFIPFLILWLSPDSTLPSKIASPGRIWFWLALTAAVSSLTLIIWTVTLFMKFGKGTPAPWDPPQRLVIRGPYRFVRNPMISGVLLFLLAESIFFESWLFLGWMIIFFIGNAIYFRLVEERGLQERFGRDYRRHKEQKLIC